jgi:Effector Associated Constant Component 1
MSSLSAEGGRHMSEDIRVEFVSGPDVDPAELDALTRALRAEILQVDEVDRVEQATAGPAPEGAKGLDVTAIGSLIVGISPGVQAIGKVVEVVRNWLASRVSSTPPLQMTIGDKSITVVPDKEQQDALVAAFVAAVTSEEGGEAGKPAQ